MQPYSLSLQSDVNPSKIGTYRLRPFLYPKITTTIATTFISVQKMLSIKDLMCLKYMFNLSSKSTSLLVGRFVVCISNGCDTHVA